MPVPAVLSFEYSWPNGGSVVNNQVDSWELKAFRRALRHLRIQLAGQPMLDLIKDQIEEADAYYKDIIEKPNGEFKESRIDLKIKEMSIAQFTTWWNVWFSEMLHQPPKVKRQEGLVETIGEHLARVRVHTCTNYPEFVKTYDDPLYPNLPAMGT